MTIKEQREKNVSDMVQWADLFQNCIYREDLKTAEDLLILMQEKLRQQQLLVNAKPIWPPMPIILPIKTVIIDPCDAIKRGNNMIETHSCHVIGGVE